MFSNCSNNSQNFEIVESLLAAVAGSIACLLRIQGYPRSTLALMALSLLHTYILLTPTATFQKAGTCLEAQQSMAKQPIKGCVSNHSRTCGKSVSEKSE